MVVEKVTYPLDDLLRTDRLPHIWCPGCGIGMALQAFLWAVKELEKEGKLERKNVCVFTGIGCTARASGFVKLDAVHAVHGRAIPVAVGAKLANIRLIPVVFSGDGDIAAIGGNHLLHAARRNFDLLTIMVNNLTYALTGGQVAPTTPTMVYSTTTPFGNPEPVIDTTKTLAALKPNYVARYSITQPVLLKAAMKKALPMRGFRFIEVLSSCPEIFGRHIGFRDPFELFLRLRKISKIRKVMNMDEIRYDWNEEITCGTFIEKDDPGYIEMYYKIYGRKREV
jgi:2-oxoglutarate ferredoxin oxidoreductase subunit beta